jgi:hypothetical protein
MDLLGQFCWLNGTIYSIVCFCALCKAERSTLLTLWRNADALALFGTRPMSDNTERLEYSRRRISLEIGILTITNFRRYENLNSAKFLMLLIFHFSNLRYTLIFYSSNSPRFSCFFWAERAILSL